MQLGKHYITRLELGITILILVGTIATFVLVQYQQNTRSKADTPSLDISAFTIKDANGNDIKCTPGNPPVCETPTTDVIIKVDKEKLPAVGQ